MAPWVVLIEAALSTPTLTVECSAVEQLLAAFAADNPSAMYSRDRYVLQVVAKASSPDGALRKVVTRWRHVVMVAGLASYKLVRAEVMTLDEFVAETVSRSDIDAVTWLDTGRVNAKGAARAAYRRVVNGTPAPAPQADHVD